MSAKKLRPRLVFADASGNIYDHPELDMLARRGGQIMPPRPDELIQLPPESELFLLPGRRAMGLDPETGQVEVIEESAVAAFVSPGHTLSATPAYATDNKAPVLPLFAYGAVGFAKGHFYVAATKVDEDPRQVFTGISKNRIAKGATGLLRRYPKNRLVAHLARCAMTYCCPAARNLALGRFEAPLPTARTCNARCVGCLSLQEAGSGFPSTQNRIDFTPTPAEIVEVMREHGGREKRPVFSFGQGCEGDPLTEAGVITRAVRDFRAKGGVGTVNVNTNAGLPDKVAELAPAGFDAIRISLVSATPELYAAYTRPKGFGLADVRESAKRAKEDGLFVSVNYLFHPGVSDTEGELEALIDFLTVTGADFVQLRNLNLDPELYLKIVKKSGALGDPAGAPSVGLANFLRRVTAARPDVRFGYFNPYLGDREEGP